MPILKFVGSEEAVHVPAAEFEVLRVLANTGDAHAPKIARASNGSIPSVASAYSMLGRLEKRNLVQRREEHVLVGDITVRRVFYTVDERINLKLLQEVLYAETPPTRADDLSGPNAHPTMRKVPSS